LYGSDDECILDRDEITEIIKFLAAGEYFFVYFFIIKFKKKIK